MQPNPQVGISRPEVIAYFSSLLSAGSPKILQEPRANDIFVVVSKLGRDEETPIWCVQKFENKKCEDGRYTPSVLCEFVQADGALWDYRGTGGKAFVTYLNPPWQNIVVALRNAKEITSSELLQELDQIILSITGNSMLNQG